MIQAEALLWNQHNYKFNFLEGFTEDLQYRLPRKVADDKFFRHEEVTELSYEKYL